MINRWLTRRRGKQGEIKGLGQSLVEFVVLLPVLLIMLSGLIEFGFMLNYYLDLVDTAREVARFSANDDPLHDETGAFNDSPTNLPEPWGFYDRAWLLTDRMLKRAGQVQLNPDADDVVISVFSVAGGVVSERYPLDQGGNGGEGGWKRWNNHDSAFDRSDIEARLSSSAANTGMVLVEIYYDYHMVLGLPWIAAFVPNPVTLHAYSIMPNSSSEPTPTPSGP